MNDPIPSPFQGDLEGDQIGPSRLPIQLLDDVKEVVRKHGYQHFMIIAAKCEGTSNHIFDGGSDIASEQLADYLRFTADHMDKIVEDNEDNNEAA